MSLKDRLRRIVASTDELESDDEIVEAALHGTDLSSSCRSREVHTLSGVLRAVTYPSAVGRPELIAELYDGSGSIDLIWLGRRDISGIEPGRRLVVSGRLSASDRTGHLVMYNPEYTLIPRSSAS